VNRLLISAIEQAKRHERTILSRGLKQSTLPSSTNSARPASENASRGDRVPDLQIELLTGTAFQRDLTPAVRARLLSAGAWLAARLLAGVLECLGTRSIALDAHVAGICTDDHYENASIDRDRTRRALSAKVAPLLRRELSGIPGSSAAARAGDHPPAATH
jgi:aspartokinase